MAEWIHAFRVALKKKREAHSHAQAAQYFSGMNDRVRERLRVGWLAGRSVGSLCLSVCMLFSCSVCLSVSAPVSVCVCVCVILAVIRPSVTT